MSQLAKPGRADQERDLQTPRPVQHQSSQEESASPSPSGRDSESLRDQRKSISSLSTHSVVSFSSDDHSEVGELPAESGGTGDVRVRTERKSSGHSGNVPADKNGDASDGDLGAMEKQLEDLKVESDSRADNNVDQEEEDEDSYLNDPLVKYTLQLHDYTVSFT